MSLSLSCTGGALLIANVEKRIAGDRVCLLEPMREYEAGS